MGKMGKQHDQEKRNYHLIIGLLVIIILLLIGIVAAIVYRGLGEQTTKASVTTTTQTTNETTSKTTSTELTSKSSSTATSTTSSSQEPATSSSEPTVSVSDLTTQQRAALVILGAPARWKFNGYPSPTTADDTIQEMALSDINQITLSTSNQDDYRTNPDDQRFDIVGKDLDGLGGVIIDTYAFGREDNNIYYYVIHQNFQAANPRQEVNSLGVADIDAIWKRYVATNDTQTVDIIASHILLK